MAYKMAHGPPNLLNIPLEIRHKIFYCASERDEGPEIIIKQQLEHMDEEIDTTTPAPQPPLEIGGEPINSGHVDNIWSTTLSAAQTPTFAAALQAEVEGTDQWNQIPDNDPADQEDQSEGRTTEINGVTYAFATLAGESDDSDEDLADADAASGFEDDDYLGEEEQVLSDFDFGHDDENEDVDDDDGEESEESEGGDQEEEELEELELPEDDKDGMKAIFERRFSCSTIGRHTKYRHTLQMVQLNDCPPPLSLLLTSKQLCAEALEFYYAKAGLYIDVTASFAHESFFGEIFEMMASKEYSPINQIRKVYLRFVWDSEFIRTYGDVGDIMTAPLLPERSKTIANLLVRATQLESIHIHWHDTMQDSASVELKNTVLEPLFYVASLNSKPGKTINVVSKEYYPEASAVDPEDPDKVRELSTLSLLGERRIEFSMLSSGHGFR